MTRSFPVVVTSYEIVIADATALQRYDWKYLVVDEGHRLKNSGCRLLRELRTISSANKLLLTGPLLACPAEVSVHFINACEPECRGLSRCALGKDVAGRSGLPEVRDIPPQSAWE